MEKTSTTKAAISFVGVVCRFSAMVKVVRVEASGVPLKKISPAYDHLAKGVIKRL
jgi:hypothetical protein